MENKLKILLDFQHFQQNSRLAQIIAKTDERYSSVLDDDDLSFVSAAGDFAPVQRRRDVVDDDL